MKKANILPYAFLGIIGVILTFTLYKNTPSDDIPIVVIANFGPHPSLLNTIKGIKQELTSSGFIENQKIKYEILNVNFEQSLLPQMFSQIRSINPKVIIPITTPVAQFAKNYFKDIPIVFTVVTDPVQSGILDSYNQSHNNITGSSDYQNPSAMLDFAKTILPNVRTLGFLYSTAEENDYILLNALSYATKEHNIKLISIPIDHPRDIVQSMAKFHHKVDLIFTGGSGAIQSSLPAISSKANTMNIPVINIDPQSVKDGITLASFGVSYENIGRNTAKLVAQILDGKEPKDLKPIYPSEDDHIKCISLQYAKKFNIEMSHHLQDTLYIGE